MKRTVRMTRRTILTLLLTFMSLRSPSYVNGYVQSGIPERRRKEWLVKLTGEICESPAGGLSDEMIEAAPQVMKGWTTSKGGVGSGFENAVAVESLMKRLVDEGIAGNTKALPTTNDYNFMLEAWAKSGEGVFATERCEQILEEMQQQFQGGNVDVKPDLSSFKIVLMAWRSSAEAFAAYRAQRLLDWMIQLYVSNGNDLALPDSDCFDTVAQLWSRSKWPDAPQSTEKLFRQMTELSEYTSNEERFRPRTSTFNALLNAWARSFDPHAVDRMQKIIDYMEQLAFVHGDEGVTPNLQTYRSFFMALAKPSNVDECAPIASATLKRIEKKYKQGQLSCVPDSVMYNTAMGLWAKTSTKDRYRKIRAILDRQILMYSDGHENTKPDVISFTSLISACASVNGNSTERQKAFGVALSAYKHLCGRSDEFGRPNHITYATMLKGCGRLLPKVSPLKSRWTARIFRHCVKDGQVGDMVLSKLQDATTEKELEDLLEGNSIDNLPASWTENVQETPADINNKKIKAAAAAAAKKKKTKQAEV